MDSLEKQLAPTYTVGQAIDSLGFGRFQIWLTALVGFANVADAMEMMILSILTPALHCHWHISQVQQATLTTVVFLGMMISSPFWGWLTDRFGRRWPLIWSGVFLFYFGMLSAFAPSFNWLLGLRFLVGFFIGGIPQVATLYAEFLPSSVRGQAILFLSFFWAAGACFESLLAWLVMPWLGWRYLLAFSSIPLFVFVALSPKFLPESPIFLAAGGRKEEAKQQIAKVAAVNGVLPPKGDVRVDTSAGAGASRGQFLHLFGCGGGGGVDGKGQRGSSAIGPHLTLSVFFLWFVAAATYYGLVLLSTEMLDSSRDVCAASSSASLTSASDDGVPAEERECSVHVCRGLLAGDYLNVVWTTLAEFPGTIIPMILINKFGRKKTLAFQSFMFSLSTVLVAGCSAGKGMLVFALFSARAFSAGFFQTVYVFTPEAFPTKLRAVAMGSGSCCARIGAMLTPYVAQVLLRASLFSAVAVYALLGLLAVAVALLLPLETTGQDLDSADGVAVHMSDVDPTDNDDRQQEGKF